VRSYLTHRDKGAVIIEVVRTWAVPAVVGVAVGSLIAAFANAAVLKLAFVLVGSVTSDVPPESVSAPSDIVDGEESVADIITGPRSPCVLSVDSGSVIEYAKEWLNAV